jgi:hypothetical protein
MNAPIERAEADPLSLGSTASPLETPPRPMIRRLPLAPIGGWRWLWKDRPSRLRQTNEALTPSFSRSRPRRMIRCGRAALMWVMIWYLVALLFPVLMKDRWQRIGPANEDRKWPALRNLVRQDTDRPLLLMLGSSRACWAFRAGCLEGMPDCDGKPLHVYNFGIPATGPISEFFYLQEMLAEGIRPRFLLIEVLPPLMCEAKRGALTEEGMMGFESISAARFLEWYPYLNRPGKRGRLWLEARIAPWYTFRRQIQLEARCLLERTPFPTYQPVDASGWTILAPVPFPAEARNEKLDIARGGYSPGLGSFRLGKKPAQALRQTLDLCRREKIPAALVVMPESSEFRSWYSEEAKASIQDFLTELRKTYGVEVIDAQRWLADEDFEDGHHTLLHGADVFTYRLHAELPRLLSQSKPPNSD